MLLMRRGRPAEAVRGEAGAPPTAIAGCERARLTAWVAMSRVFEGNVEPAVREARAVLETSDDELARALATNALAIAADAARAVRRGRRADRAAAWAGQSRPRSREAHDARPHMILGLMLARLDRLDEATATIERGRRAAEALGFADALPVYHYQAAFVAFCAGTWTTRWPSSRRTPSSPRRPRSAGSRPPRACAR